MTYTILSSEPWMIQTAPGSNEVSLEVDEDPSLVGLHTLSIEVTSDDYPSEIATKRIDVQVDVQCTDPDLLLETWTTPPVR